MLLQARAAGGWNRNKIVPEGDSGAAIAPKAPSAAAWDLQCVSRPSAEPNPLAKTVYVKMQPAGSRRSGQIAHQV